MKRGHVSQRHLKSCDRKRKRCACPWAFVVDGGRASDGKRQQVTKSGFESRTLAEEAAQRVIDACRGGSSAAHRQTVGDYLDEWLASKRNLRPTTSRSYRSHIDLYLRPYLGHLRLAELQPRQVDRMYVEMRRKNPKLKPATVRRVHATLRSALGKAVKQNTLPYNPASHVELESAPRPRVRVWDPAQVGAFLDAIAADRMAPLFHLVAMCGLRRGEAAGLRWVDVDLDAGSIRIEQQLVQVGHEVLVGEPKTRTGVRTISLDEGTVAVLRAHRAAQNAERLVLGDAWTDSGLVFTREDGAALHPETLTRSFTRLAKAAGLPTIRLHDLRHTSASLALAAGVAMKVVSERLGHSSTTITADTYTHVLPAVAQDAATRIADIVPRAPQPLPVLAPGEHEPAAAPPRRRRSDKRAGQASGPPGARTLNPRIKSAPDMGHTEAATGTVGPL